MTRVEERLVIRFGGRDHEQTVGIPLKYIDAEDEETAELMLLARLQQIGYHARRGTTEA